MLMGVPGNRFHPIDRLEPILLHPMTQAKQSEREEGGGGGLERSGLVKYDYYHKT